MRQQHPSRPARAAFGAALLTMLTALCGCSSRVDAGGGAPDKGYVSGDGSVTVVRAAERREPVTFAGQTLDGGKFDVTDHRGQVVVVNVWGSWCPPCISEAPGLQEVWDQVGDRDVQFVGVNSRDQAAAARAHERRFGVTYPSIDDDAGRVLLALRGSLPPSAIPSTLVLDRAGRVAARVLGEVRPSVLEGIVDDTLAEQDA